MGLLVDGQWDTDRFDTKSTGGEFVRKDSQFRHWIGKQGFVAEAGRYQLFVSLACPWARFWITPAPTTVNSFRRVCNECSVSPTSNGDSDCDYRHLTL